MSVKESEVLSLANAILVHVGLPRRVDTLKQCNSSLFSQLYETLTGSRVPCLALQAPTSEAVKCQAVIDALNAHLSPHVRLDHIHGYDVAQLDTISLKNLLDIFFVLFHVPPTSAVGAEDEDAYGSCSESGSSEFGEKVEQNEANDSNVISTEGFSVISEVLREELDRSSHSTITDSTAELLRPVPVARLPPSIVNTAAKHMHTHVQHVPPQMPHKSYGESSATTTSSNSCSVMADSQPSSLTISSLQSTSTEGCGYDQRVISQAGETAPRGSAAVPSGRKEKEGALGLSAVSGKTEAMFIPSGESSIGTTPSPNLRTPPQSPRQNRQLSPLHHSTPHTSTRSRIFPASASTSVASSQPHPLERASVTPGVTVASHLTAATRAQPSQEQSTLVSEESTLVPQSSPSLTGRSKLLQDLTITDLHTTTMSSRGEEADVPSLTGQTLSPPPLRPPGAHKVDNSYPTRSKTPPSVRRRLHVPKTTSAVCTCATPHPSRASTTAQKVHFSQSTERRERARHESSLSSEQSDVEVGSLSSIQHELGLDSHMAQTRANVLATLYQNYLSELKSAQTANPSGKKGGTTGKTGSASKTKLKSRSRPTSKVASSKHRKHDTSRKRSKKPSSTPHPSRLTPSSSKPVEKGPSEESSGVETDPEPEEVYPPTPTKIAVGDNMFPLIEREFPFVYVSPSTTHRLMQKQLQQVSALTRSKVSQKNRAVKKMFEIEEKQKALHQIIKKELDHTRRMQRRVEQQREKVAVKSSIHAKRQAAARARRYYNDYELRLKAKLQRKRTREEMIFKRTFEEGLELQRERIRELKRYAKEKQEEHEKKHQDQLDSMENYYRDQLSLLTESMVKEREETAVRDKAQYQMVQRMKRELRQKIESEIKELQECIDREEDVIHFRELDAQNLRHKLSRITFTTTVK